jgi:Ran GTPase-activating protein (RanGAP) involved in mRNA processing and transport
MDFFWHGMTFFQRVRYKSLHILRIIKIADSFFLLVKQICENIITLHNRMLNSPKSKNINLCNRLFSQNKKKDVIWLAVKTTLKAHLQNINNNR